MQEEERQTRQVRLSTLTYYMRSGGMALMCAAALFSGAQVNTHTDSFELLVKAVAFELQEKTILFFEPLIWRGAHCTGAH
jgi:hypothetical protein